MRFLVLVKNTPDREGTMPSPEVFEAMGKFNEEMLKAGVMIGAEGLRPSKDAVRLRFEGTAATVTDGPFTESKEIIGGFWMLQCKTIDEAVEWIKRAPFPYNEEVEIRPVMEAEDFAADEILPETRAREIRMRDQLG